MLTDLLSHGVLIVDGEEHDRYRELMEPPLHPSKLPNYTDMMLAQTDHVSSQWEDGDTVDMLVEGRKIALLVIIQALFSRDAWDDIPHIRTPILKAIAHISPGPWIFWRKMPRFGYGKPLKMLDDYLFFITNILITFDMTLLLANVSQERFANIKQIIKKRRSHGRQTKTV
jgi:hypothetical protein